MEANISLQPPATPSVTRTRSRRQQFTDDEVKPLLANLSPAATLEALMSTNVVTDPTDQRRVFLRASVEKATESEREWGIRAALAAQKIREWLGEVIAWPWRPHQGGQGNSFEDEWQLDRIEEYLKRIETIRDDMETLQVEELKDHVRKAHARYNTISTRYENLEDFAAVITAMIVQSLPPLLQLDSLLKAWTTRSVVLRKKPAFLQEKQECEETLQSTWIALSHGEDSGVKRAETFTWQTLASMQATLQDQIACIGQKIDCMLDVLEGTPDVLPEAWIDAVDHLENEYSSWVVKATESALNNELQGTVKQHSEAANKAVSRDQLGEGRAEGADPVLFQQVDGPCDSKLAAPFDTDIPLKEFSPEASHSSRSSVVRSDSSRPDSSVSGVSSERSSAEIGRAFVATNPGSPVRVTTPIRQSFQSAQIQRFGSVKSRDIRRLLVRRSDSCPSTIPLAPEEVRRASADGTSPASQHPQHSEPDPGPGIVHAIEVPKKEPKEPVGDKGSYIPTPSLSPPKVKSRFEQCEDFPAGSADIRVQKQRSTNTPKPVPPTSTTNASPVKHQDKLEARISSILHAIPADIRLSSSSAGIPPPLLSQPKNPLRRSITPKLLRTKTPTPSSSPSLTLAPASDPQKPHNRGGGVHDPEIKVYHLHTSTNTPNSKDATPVKLYVRLVGAEGERVMVRVGGGWADLGEYLKDYALHHGATSGKRSVSDFQVTNLPTPGSGTPGTGGSRPGLSRPGSRLGGSRPGSSAGTRPGISRPGSRNSYFDGADDPPSPSPVPMGLAGPKSRKASVGTEQQRMVDEVVGQAKEGGGKFGVKVGGIKRVFLKRRSTLGEKG